MRQGVVTIGSGIAPAAAAAVEATIGMPATDCGKTREVAAGRKSGDAVAVTLTTATGPHEDTDAGKTTAAAAAAAGVGVGVVAAIVVEVPRGDLERLL